MVGLMLPSLAGVAAGHATVAAPAHAANTPIVCFYTLSTSVLLSIFMLYVRIVRKQICLLGQKSLPSHANAATVSQLLLLVLLPQL